MIRRVRPALRRSEIRRWWRLNSPTNGGADLELVLWEDDVNDVARQLFEERQGLYVVTTTSPADKLFELAEKAGVPNFFVGIVQGNALTSRDSDENFIIPLTDLRAAHESFFKNWMET